MAGDRAADGTKDTVTDPHTTHSVTYSVRDSLRQSATHPVMHPVIPSQDSLSLFLPYRERESCGCPTVYMYISVIDLVFP